MPTLVDTSGLDRLRARFDRIVNPNPTPLLITIKQHMDDDNRKGILAGLDKDGISMAPVTYRPDTKPSKKRVPLTAEMRLGQNPRAKKGMPSRIGSGVERTNNNLTGAEYRLLDGPPLAPRRQFSRVITNYQTDVGQVSHTVWEVVGAWINVLSIKGVPFLIYHFDGIGQKVRDLRGIRPAGVEKIRKSARAWMISEIQRD